MLKIYVRKSSVSADNEAYAKENLAKLKAKVIAILKNKDSEDLKKAIDYFNKDEIRYTHLEKSLEGKWIEKAGYGVGTIRIWKGKKYKKVSSTPTRWVRVFDKEDRGAKSSMTRLIHKVQMCTTAKELYDFCMSNHAIFQDENGVDLPIMDQLRNAIEERKNTTGTDIGKKTSNVSETKSKKEIIDNLDEAEKESIKRGGEYVVFAGGEKIRITKDDLGEGKTSVVSQDELRSLSDKLLNQRFKELGEIIPSLKDDEVRREYNENYKNFQKEIERRESEGKTKEKGSKKIRITKDDLREDKESLQNKLLTLNKERIKNLAKIKKNHAHIMEIKEAKNSGLASEKMLKDMDEHIKKLSDENEELLTRNYQIENEGSDITQKIDLLEDNETKATTESNFVNKKYLKVVEKLDEEVTKAGRSQMKRSNYVINGKNMNIATNGKILIAQKGHDSSLEEGTISSMERVYNNVGTDVIEIPEGIDSIVKNAKKKVDTENGKVDSNIQFGDYVFNTAQLQMAQDVLDGFEGAKITGNNKNKNSAVRFDKGQFSIILMPMALVRNSQSVVGSNAQQVYAETKAKAAALSDDELQKKEDELNNTMIHDVKASDDMETYQKLYNEWQIYHTERLDREYKKNAEKQRVEREAELEKKRAEREAKKTEREAKVKEKEAAGTMIRKPEDAIGNNNVDVSLSGSTLKITDKNGNLLKMVRNVSNAGKLQANKKFDVFQKVKKELPELNSPEGLNKILISGNDYYVLDNKKLYTFDEYKNRNVKKSIFDFFDVELEENEDDEIPSYNASQPDLFNNTANKVNEALDSVFGC